MTKDNEDGKDYGRDLPEADVDPVEGELTPEKVEAGKKRLAEGPNGDTLTGANDTDRAEGPVGIPHWNALKDVWRVLPCQVNPVNTKDWYTVTEVRTVENSTEVVLVTSDGEELRGRDIGDPVLVRTNDPDAHKLH